MIARLIQWCVHNRAMVLLLTACLVGASLWAMSTIKIDAIPDLSDVQVIIKTEYPGQAPQIVEDQVTYPLTTAMLAVPYAKVVRGYSMFGDSFVYIIFEDGTDLYWARSRVLEQLSFVRGRLPAGVDPQLGPDATGVGWVYQYVLSTGPWCPEHPRGLWHDPQTEQWYASRDDAPHDDDVRARLLRHRIFPGREACPLTGGPLRQPDVDLADLRGLQDWYMRYELTAVDGVSEVAPVGGFIKQYQVVADPVKLLALNIPLREVRMAIDRSNIDVGGRVIEMSETEYMVRGLGYLGSLSEQQLRAAREQGRMIQRVRTDQVLEDLRGIALDVTEAGAPIYLADVAEVRVGPDIRLGVADWNGEGDVVGGIIVMRFGENARRTIADVKVKLAELEQGLPPGVGLRTAYDRSDLIDRAVNTLRHTLLEEITVVALVCILFLLHARSELVAVFVVPTGVLASLLLMRLLGINANIMSLGGIAIAIGVMVDSSIVMVENAHKHLDREEDRLHQLMQAGQTADPRPRTQLILEAAQEVGPSLFFSLLIITVSFLPVFVLGEQSGRLFKPLAYTKTFAMTMAAFLAVTIIPVLMSYFITARVLPRRWGWRVNLAVTLAAMLLPAGLLAGAPLGPLAPYRTALVIGWMVLVAMLLVPQKIIHERANPISNLLQRLYHPFFVLAMHFKITIVVTAALLLASTLWPLSQLGSEFMPPLEEGDLLYMPTTDPSISITKVRELLQQTDKLIKQFPEVDTVMGKTGRAGSATDPAPLSMIETTIVLHRDKSRWRTRPVEHFYDDWPAWAAWLPSLFFDDVRTITINELLYGYDLPGTNDGQGNPLRVPGLNDIVQFPGVTNAWTMPIRTRIDMLSTGIRTPVGVKIMGPDLTVLGKLAEQTAQVLKTAEGVGQYTVSAFPERTVGGQYLDIRIDHEQIARYGLTIDAVQEVIATALGGMEVTTTVEGLERYPVNVRYPHELRDNLPALRQALVATPAGAQVPLGQLASLTVHPGPPMIRSENARPTSWVFVDIAGIDVGTYVRNSQRAVARQVELPPGYSIVWSGQYEYMQAARARLMIVVPLAGVAIVLLLYLATRSWLRVAIVLLAVPFSLVGAFWLLYALDYNLSLAVWVGIIALAGLDAETGLVMLLYLDNSYERFKNEGRMRNATDLWHAVHDGAVQRIRPKTMTVMTTFIGLLPLLWASGAGADTMRRLAAPMIGGLATSFIAELLLYPVLFYIARRTTLPHDSP
ncbi:MAG: efflux RND transporter permease subunit [Phycisphaeraceae bacterium]|nr:efflux RND transporter permease subunit [Phycisphaeraceae bacterium]